MKLSLRTEQFIVQNGLDVRSLSFIQKQPGYTEELIKKK